MKKGPNEPRASSSCAACKLLKRRCSPNCIFAPYFRADEPKKFAKVHKVFGASNVSKILNEVPEEHRQDTVNSLSYEAEARLQDPVHGCIGAIVLLQRRLIQLQHDLSLARARLAQYKASNLYASNNNNDNGFFDSGDHNVNIIHMNLYREELISDIEGYNNTSYNEFGQVHDLLPL